MSVRVSQIKVTNWTYGSQAGRCILGTISINILQCYYYPTLTACTIRQVLHAYKAIIDTLLFLFQFTTPSFPGDPWLGTFPVTFITYEVSTTDGMNHTVEIYYDNTGEVCVCLNLLAVVVYVVCVTFLVFGLCPQ